MHTFIESPLQIGSLKVPHRVIQGPLAGYSCSAFRTLFYDYQAPGYCVSEMISAVDLMTKHSHQSRYLHRAPVETLLAYQLSGTDPNLMAQAAFKLEGLGADLIDINCGCPKTKIRKKGAGSALLETPDLLVRIIEAVRASIRIPLTVKIRLQEKKVDACLAKRIEAAGADALIVHGRRWMDDYDLPCDIEGIKNIKHQISIPVIANGDIKDSQTLQQTIEGTGCDGFMIGRAGTGAPYLYQSLLEPQYTIPDNAEQITLFLTHLERLAVLENEQRALLQSRSLSRYYFKDRLHPEHLKKLYTFQSLKAMSLFLGSLEIDHLDQYRFINV